MKKSTKKQVKAEKPKITFLSYFAPIVSAITFTIFACLNLRTAMWFDESYSAYLIRGNFGQIWQMTSMDVHPPFYYFCLKVWSMLFGTSDFALRSMSVFFSGVAIILAFFLLRRWFSEKTAALSTFALSLAPILIRYSQEMRMYGLVFAIVIGATLLLDIALKSKKKLAWFFYALLICLGMWTHYFTALAWLAHLGFIIYYFRKHGLQKTVFWAYPLAVLLYLPWIPSFFNQVKQVQNGFWIPPVDLATPFGFLSESLTYRGINDATNWLVILIFSTIILAAYLLYKSLAKTTKETRQNFTFLAVLTFVPPLLLMLLSLPPLQPTYMTRYVAYSASLVWVILGIAIVWGARYGKRLLAGLLAVLALICAITGIVAVDTEEKSNHNRNTILAIQAMDKEPSPILIQVAPMDYYDFFFYETTDHPVYSVNVEFIWGSLEPIRVYNQNYLSEPAEFLETQDHFWFIIPADERVEPIFDDFEVANKIKTNKFNAREFIRKQ
ncbi:glycosyltransferase family 39 protein [Candidatus Saccharibacteria bacterium]|nr:glycosyltransferase family 39 protein [Candidatus Saccharibacteria bacterium]